MPEKDKPTSAQINDVVELVKDYAQQETLGPIKGAGRWLGAGAAGAVLLGGGSALFVLGLLRMLQTEFDETFNGEWSYLLPYLIALLASVIVMAFAAWRISKKKTLQKESS